MRKCAFTLFFLWASLGQVFAQATILPPGETCYSSLSPTSGGPSGTGTGYVGLLGTITAGSGGTSGTYGGVALTGGVGSGATANITVSGGGVTAVAIVNAGIGYAVADVLSASSANIGGVTGFSVPVSSVAINQSLAGGSVAYYIPSTNTYKQTWFNSDQASGHQNTNPVKLDANGCAIVYGSGIYRQVLEDSQGNIVFDQLTASTSGPTGPYWANLASGTPNAVTVIDASFTSTDGQIIGFIPLFTNTGATTLNPSGFGTYAIVKDTASGAVALTGGELVANSPSNVVYVSFSATQQNFHIINLVQTSASASPTQAPQGYLNLVGIGGGGPVQGSSDVIAATTVYYDPYIGNQIPIWNGTSFTILTFPELNIALSSSAQSSNGIYDVCIFNNAGTPVGVFGPAWSDSAAGAGSRGTGNGTAQIQRQNGIWVNSVAVNANNGSNTYTIPALECTYVGSIYVDATAGQVSAYRTWGQSRKFGVWNAYNRVSIILSAGDSTASWQYGSATIRPSRNQTTNSLTTFTGLPEEWTHFDFRQNFNGTSGGGWPQIGIGYNSTTAFCGFAGNVVGGSTATPASATAICDEPPSLGINTATSLENVPNAGITQFDGTEVNMYLKADWRG